ncbi:MAG TPA: hypothetical protein VGL58_08915 [Caulobacteraceae bacterium]
MSNFGETRRAKTPRGPMWLAAPVIVGAAVVLVGALLLVNHRHDAAADKADTAAWTVVGPPCQSITPGYWTTLAIEHPTPFRFEGLQGQMAHGDVSCTTLDQLDGRHVADYPVCQFSAPFAVKVATAGGEAAFETIPGKPMTISIPPGGAPRCVVGANLTNW